jgi:hypothetical protein
MNTNEPVLSVRTLSNTTVYINGINHPLFHDKENKFTIPEGCKQLGIGHILIDGLPNDRALIVNSLLLSVDRGVTAEDKKILAYHNVDGNHTILYQDGDNPLFPIPHYYIDVVPNSEVKFLMKFNDVNEIEWYKNYKFKVHLHFR